VHAADGHREPVAAGLGDKAGGFVDAGEAPPGGEQLIIRRRRAFLMPQHRPQLGLNRDARRMGQGDHFPRGGDVVRQAQARAVDHHRVVAQTDRLADNRAEVDRQAVLVDDRDVIQVQADMRRRRPLLEFGHDRRRPAGLELGPLQAGHFDQGEAVLIDHGADHRGHHRQVGNVEGRHGDPGPVGIAHDGGQIQHSPSWQGRALRTDADWPRRYTTA